MTATQSRGFRPMMLMFLAFVYLFVGIAHNLSCIDHAFAANAAIEQSSDTADDSRAQIGIVLCDHCPTCIPAVMPAPAVAAGPSALTWRPVMAAVSVLIADHPRLDTPPPKPLT